MRSGLSDGKCFVVSWSLFNKTTCKSSLYISLAKSSFNGISRRPASVFGVSPDIYTPPSFLVIVFVTWINLAFISISEGVSTQTSSTRIPESIMKHNYFLFFGFQLNNSFRLKISCEPHPHSFHVTLRIEATHSSSLLKPSQNVHHYTCLPCKTIIYIRKTIC